MCGIVGIVGRSQVSQALFDSLTVMQHRGQDAAGMITVDSGMFHLRKANGLVRDVFRNRHMQRLTGNLGIAHVRYPTAGTSSSAEAQPFYVNSPYGIALAHNGNLTNAKALQEEVLRISKRHINTTSDSELLLNILADELQKCDTLKLSPEDIFKAVANVHSRIRGAYAVVAAVVGNGILAFRDPNGIRPLALGKRETPDGDEYMVASESVALDSLEFTFIRDVAPGEAVYISQDGQLYTQQCSDKPVHVPCIFEFVYFARPDSFIDGASVYAARVNMGVKLGQKIAKDWAELDIDVVIPIPETSIDIALQIAHELALPYRQGFVKNRYIGRTFIMPGQSMRSNSVRKKLNAIKSEFAGKNVLLVDDSVVRGTTSGQIIKMAREAGAKKVYFASAAPEIRFPNVYGIDMPTSNELIAHGREVDEICELIGADGLIYQDLEDLKAAVAMENKEILQFETSVFDGHYITDDVDQAYLEQLDSIRSEGSKSAELQDELTNLDIHNDEGVEH